MRGGPRGFSHRSTNNDLLRCQSSHAAVSLRDVRPLWSRHSSVFGSALWIWDDWSFNPRPQAAWFGLFPFRSPLLRESMSLSAPPGTEMFQFPGFPLPDGSPPCGGGFPIRTPPSQRLSPARRGFSQVSASFIGSSARASTVDPCSLDQLFIQPPPRGGAAGMQILARPSLVMLPASTEAQKRYRLPPRLSTPSLTDLPVLSWLSLHQFLCSRKNPRPERRGLGGTARAFSVAGGWFPAP